MTRQLLIFIAILIAIVPFIGISSSAQNFITTVFSLFTAVTLFFSRKPRMRSVSRRVESPYMPEAETSPGHETHVAHDNTSHVTQVILEVGKPHHKKGTESAPEVISHELPTHPIAPRVRRKKAITFNSLEDSEVGGVDASHDHVPLPFHSVPSLPLGVASTPAVRVVRPRRAKNSRSILAEEEPIRPADAVIPASELAAEHSAFYNALSGK